MYNKIINMKYKIMKYGMHIQYIEYMTGGS